MGAYDLDLHAWAQEQADVLRRRSPNELDWDNIAEEIESLGGQVRWELYNRLSVLLTHLLKWREQPGGRCGSWASTIRVQRRDLAKLVRRNPSLKACRDEEFAEAYASARLRASSETFLDEACFPVEPPFTVVQALDPEWLPGDDADGQSSTVSNGS